MEGTLDSLWTMIGAILVILMLGGFILLEAGSTRMKNAGHIAGKTILTFGIGSLVFWALGFGLIFGDDAGGFLGLGHFFYDGGQFADTNLSTPVYFVFQLAFAAISLTIAFGGFAERAKMVVYVIFSIMFSIVVYPIIAHWVWGGGWLSSLGTQDFAGSTVVHLTGAMAALAATIILKPRLGKYGKNGVVNSFQGHNQVYTSLAVLLLWVGWFGFNAGSTVSVADAFFGYVALNTQLGAAAGAVSALIVSWIIYGKADVSSILNGTISGLVAITASCAFVEPWAAVVIGLAAGVITILTARMLEKKQIDDPIFAVSVHGTPGVWGTLSTGLFATPELASIGQAGLFYGGGLTQLGVQVLGVVASGAFAFVISYVLLKLTQGLTGSLRVSKEEEMMGLDMSEHGVYGYPELMYDDPNKVS
ncbi:ammonium transporter [Tuberibacillus sp. Marseille-P3662]|uniref:ammonium transporter n=1 Tax=Tuberibacillus sp. Marseille-P3662 TaxID=1965358 RepID=UPI000A1C85E9|nr:ammonium transporter [Tuberibacillus sp. Marseille-P3662]